MLIVEFTMLGEKMMRVGPPGYVSFRRMIERDSV
jgi:hypothetical protein